MNSLRITQAILFFQNKNNTAHEMHNCTYANACGDRRLADPEGDPGENHQQAGGHVCFQDEVQDAPLQLEMKDQPGIIS